MGFFTRNRPTPEMMTKASLSADFLNAVRNVMPSKAEECLSLGADIEARDREGRTAFITTVEGIANSVSESSKREMGRGPLDPGPQYGSGHSRDVFDSTSVLRDYFTARRNENSAEYYTNKMHGIDADPYRYLRSGYVGLGGTLRILMEGGADVNAKDRDGNTGLLLSADALRISSGFTRFLISLGADVNARNKNGSTALMYVSGYPGNFPGSDAYGSASLLLDRGADANAADENGTTPLMFAAFMGNAEIVKLLLDHGANRDAEDYRHRTAQDYNNGDGLVPGVLFSLPGSKSNKESEAYRRHMKGREETSEAFYKSAASTLEKDGRREEVRRLLRGAEAARTEQPG